MPIYEYQCSDCENFFEQIVLSSSAQADITCTKCNSKNIKKAISASCHKLGGAGGTLPLKGIPGGSSRPGYPS